MRLFLHLLSILTALAAAVPLPAQNPTDIAPPKPPLVAAVPESFDWTITAKTTTPPPSPEAAKHAALRITEVHTTKTGKIRRDDISFNNGTRSTHWIVEQYLFWTSVQGEVCVSDLHGAPGLTPEDPDPTLPNCIPGVRWLQPTYFDKVIVVDKRPCYHYLHNEVEAWLDAETQFPVAYKNGDTVYTYKYGVVPAEPLTLPPDYQRAWTKIQQALNLRRQSRNTPVSLR